MIDLGRHCPPFLLTILQKFRILYTYNVIMIKCDYISDYQRVNLDNF